MSLDLILTLCLMFFGAYGASYVPFAIDVPEDRVNLLSCLGGGLMIGSALAMIVPEGFHAFGEHGENENAALGEGLPGLALVAGFLLMMLLDHLQSSGSKDHAGCGHVHVHKKHGVEEAGPTGLTETDDKGERRGPEKAISGLIIHCIADGLAMGSAFLTGDATLSFILGTAMVLHKAPMAFGLSAYLLSCRWNWARAQNTLLLFSATAPVSTVVTLAVLRWIPFFSGEQAVALVILFSAGTFLYASTMHILPEVSSNSGGVLKGQELMAVCGGATIPVLLSWGHHHH